MDRSGNVYVNDNHANDCIQKFTSLGSFITQWGSWGSGNKQFSDPEGIAIDGSGNIYVADYMNCRIQKLDHNGNYLTQWGSMGSGNLQFLYPIGIAVDSSNYVYVTDFGNNRVVKYDSNGNYQTQWGTSGSGNKQFIQPIGIGVDHSGYVYVADSYNNRIQKFDSNGNYQTQWGSSGSGNKQFSDPEYLAVGTLPEMFMWLIVETIVFRSLLPPELMSPNLALMAAGMDNLKILRESPLTPHQDMFMWEMVLIMAAATAYRSLANIQIKRVCPGCFCCWENKIFIPSHCRRHHFVRAIFFRAYRAPAKSNPGTCVRFW